VYQPYKKWSIEKIFFRNQSLVDHKSKKYRGFAGGVGHSFWSKRCSLMVYIKFVSNDKSSGTYENYDSESSIQWIEYSTTCKF